MLMVIREICYYEEHIQLRDWAEEDDGPDKSYSDYNPAILRADFEPGDLRGSCDVQYFRVHGLLDDFECAIVLVKLGELVQFIHGNRVVAEDAIGYFGVLPGGDLWRVPGLDGGSRPNQLARQIPDQPEGNHA
jgi:hypothetical protein